MRRVPVEEYSVAQGLDRQPARLAFHAGLGSERHQLAGHVARQGTRELERKALAAAQ